MRASVLAMSAAILANGATVFLPDEGVRWARFAIAGLLLVCGACVYASARAERRLSRE